MKKIPSDVDEEIDIAESYLLNASITNNIQTVYRCIEKARDTLNKLLEAKK